MARNSHAPASSQAGFLVTLFASTFLMGSSFVAGKILLQQGFTPMILVGWRFFAAALATLPLVLAGERNIVAALLPAKAGLRDVALVILIGLLQTAAVMGLLFWAMQFISASTAAILLFTNPIWVAVLGRIFLGESLHRARLVGLLLGVVGVALAIGISPSMFSGGMTLAGEIIGIVSALCWASATLINKRAALPLILGLEFLANAGGRDRHLGHRLSRWRTMAERCDARAMGLVSLAFHPRVNRLIWPLVRGAEKRWSNED